MLLLADLHIHSPYSRATSRELRLETLHVWAQKKGLGLVGTGDFTHPAWFREILEKLEPAEEGFWRLKPELAASVEAQVPQSCRSEVRFVLQGEISTIYKKAGRTRKVHHLILMPDRISAERLILSLERVGNLRSDGRPILGLDSRDLLELVLNASEQSILIPAHIWTPWFSVFGSKSGFDDLNQCYGDLTRYITALETGLSSDPAMNWRCSQLDSYRLVSNSDAHSPSRLGREANRLDIPICFSGLKKALSTGEGLLGTLEFFPEEGKYHLDGHRECGVRMEVRDTLSHDFLCPSCGKPLTVGVLHRVEELADREPGARPEGSKPFERLLPLEEVLGELLGCSSSSRKVKELYSKILSRWGPEIPFLSQMSLEVLRGTSLAPLAEALDRMRRGEVILEAGFDGQYGVVRLFRPGERSWLGGQMSLLGDWDRFTDPPAPRYAPRVKEAAHPSVLPPGETQRVESHPLDLHQQKVVLSSEKAILVIAGPGTGKTRALTQRLAFLIKNGQAKPEEVLAITFTQKAALEMLERLSVLLETNHLESGLSVKTLHAYGLGLIKNYWDRIRGGTGPILADELMRKDILKRVFDLGQIQGQPRSYTRVLESISRYKQGLLEQDHESKMLGELVRAYDQELSRQGAVDYEDLLLLPLELLRRDEEVKDQVTARIRHLFVDEFQDMNPIQLELLGELMGPQTTVTLIGDPDQSIYGFRGARPAHLLELKTLVPEARVMLLELNYRSTATIVEAASGVISHNPALFPRSMRPSREAGPPIQICLFDSPVAEAIFVAQEIDRLLGGTSHWAMLRQSPLLQPQAHPLAFGDIAVLCRLHSMLALIGEALARQGIPCEKVQRAGEESPMGLGTLLGKIRQILGGLPESSSQQWNPQAPSSCIGMMDSRKKASEVINLLLQELSEKEPAIKIYLARQESQFQRFLESASTWPGDVREFLDYWVLLLEEDHPQPATDKVSLMTAHAAKGLEFQVVFVVGCDEDVFPLRQQGKLASLEEERRLFYVAMTRAKELLYLTTAKSRELPGGIKGKGPSRFLKEIPKDKLKRSQPTLGSSLNPVQLTLFTNR